jgi:hypothetical protein
MYVEFPQNIVPSNFSSHFHPNIPWPLAGHARNININGVYKEIVQVNICELRSKFLLYRDN